MKNRIKLGDICNLITDGTHFTPTYISSGVPFLRVTDITESNDSKKFISREEHLELIKRCNPQKGDILYTKNGTIGVAKKINWDYEFSIFVSLCLLKPKKEVVDTDYLVHYLNTELALRQALNHSKTATISNLHLVEIKKIQIPVPPIPIQKKIAAILDAANDYRQKTKALIEKYEQLSQSVFLEMFENVKGEKIRLDECCEINPKKSEIAHIRKDTEVSFVPMANVSNKGELILTEVRNLSEVWNGFTFFQENDVVFAKITPCMENGKGAIMRNLINKIGFGTTEFHVLRPNPSLTTSTWLYFLTSSNKFRRKAEKNMTGSAGQKRVPTEFFSKFKVICPPINLQNQFAERIQLIEEQKQQAQASLQKAEVLFNSLLQKAFKGELV